MRVAIFCLEQARQAIALVRDSSGEPDSWHGMDDFDRVEFYVLKLDHVYESCCQLNKSWPSEFAATARSAANSFVQLWNGTAAEQLCEACASNEFFDGPTRQLQAKCESCKDGKQRCRSCREPICDGHANHRFGTDLRDAYAHYAEALATPDHRLRGRPAGFEQTMRGVDLPVWSKGHMGTPGEAPETVWLLGKDYWLHGVHEALIELEREFAALLTEPDDPWKLREDA